MRPLFISWRGRVPETALHCELRITLRWMGLPRTLKVLRSTQRSWLHVRRVRYRLVTKAYILIDVAAGKAEEEVNSPMDLEGGLDVDQVIGQCDIIMVVNVNWGTRLQRRSQHPWRQADGHLPCRRCACVKRPLPQVRLRGARTSKGLLRRRPRGCPDYDHRAYSPARVSRPLRRPRAGSRRALGHVGA